MTKRSDVRSTADQTAIWHGLVAGAAAGITSRVATYPADTIKAKLQLQSCIKGRPLLYSSTWDALTKVVRAEGVAGLYRGLGAILVGVIPANMAYFGGIESAAAFFPETALGHAAVGVWAQLVAQVVFTPVDIVKERMQVQSMMRHAYSYTGASHLVYSLVRAQGVKGLMKGYWASNAVWLPWNAIFVSCYEQSKAAAAAALHQPAPTTLPAWAFALCSGCSAAVAAVCTHPVDVVKTRLQVLAGTTSPGSNLTAMQVARELLHREGLVGFTHGCTARVLNIAPGSAVSWFIYELGKRQLQGGVE